MKLSKYAKQNSITYRTAYTHWKKGYIKGKQLPSGTIVVFEENKQTDNNKVILYARVSSSENKVNLETQLNRILLEKQGKSIEIINSCNNDKDDLMQDFVSIVTSFCARLYGLRRSKRRTEKIIKELKDD